MLERVIDRSLAGKKKRASCFNRNGNTVVGDKNLEELAKDVRARNKTGHGANPLWNSSIERAAIMRTDTGFFSESVIGAK